jgi:hypothetical protein
MINLDDIPCKGLEQYHYEPKDYTEKVQFWAEGRAPFWVAIVPESLYHGSIFAHIAEIDIRTRFWRGFKPGDRVLDAGHGYGAYTFPPAALGATVYAIDPEFYPGFKESCELNGYFYGRLDVRHHALGGRDGSAIIEGKSVSIRTIDSTRLALTHLNLDTEGMEEEILRGAEWTLREFRPKIILENHLFLDKECEAKCDAFLFGLGVGYRKLASIVEGACTHSYYEAT